MGVLTNILKGKPDSRLRKLADIIGANERDEQWRDELTARQHNLRSQVQAARDTMVENPTAESLERFLEARQAEHATGAFLGEANTQHRYDHESCRKAWCTCKERPAVADT